MPIFSIIMPVYNAEDTLSAAVDSILRQSLSDFELILVNDASTDNSAPLCDAIACREPRITVHHRQENGGIAAARNDGLRQAAGDYVLFIDADDTVAPELLARVQAAVEAQAILPQPEPQPDIILFGMTELYYNAAGKLVHTRVVCPQAAVYPNQAAVRAAVLSLEMQTLFGYACNKAYRRRFLVEQGAAFEPLPTLEDYFFNASLISAVHTMTVLSIAPYAYARRRSDSVSQRFMQEYFTLHARRVESMMNLLEAWGLLSGRAKTARDDSKTKLAALYQRYFLSAIMRNCQPQANMDHAGRKNFIAAQLHTPLWRSLRGHALPKNMPMRMLNHAMCKQSMCILLAIGRLVFLTNRFCPALFIKVK